MIFEALANRKKLTEPEKRQYWNLKRGYEGEVNYDERLKSLVNHVHVFNDLCYIYNNKVFQIDSLLLTNHYIYHLEIKNFQGEIYYKDNEFFNEKGKHIENPTFQLERSHSLLRQMLHNLGFSFPIKSYVLFINPECTIYLPRRIDHFILPTQINRFMKDNFSSSTMNEEHLLLGKKLLAMHVTDPPYQTLPTYTFHELKKGIRCQNCGAFAMVLNKYHCICERCHEIALTDETVLCNVKEFQLLFPKTILTTSRLQQWCDETSSKRIQRILNKNYTKRSQNKGAFYE